MNVGRASISQELQVRKLRSRAIFQGNMDNEGGLEIVSSSSKSSVFLKQDHRVVGFSKPGNKCKEVYYLSSHLCTWLVGCWLWTNSPDVLSGGVCRSPQAGDRAQHWCGSLHAPGRPFPRGCLMWRYPGSCVSIPLLSGPSCVSP